MAAGKEISKEEGVMPLIPSSFSVAGQIWTVVVEHADAGCLCVMKLTCAIVSSSSRMHLAEAVWTSSYDCSRRHQRAEYCVEGLGLY